MNNLIVAVFKTIAIFIIASVFLSLALTTFTIFTTYSKMENVANMMQSELSRNNHLLGGEAGKAAIDYYATQLYDICQQTQVRSGNAAHIVELENIVIKEGNSTGDTVTYTYNPGTQSCEAAYTQTTNVPTDRSDTVGQYGEVKTISINYRTNFYTVLVSNGGRNIGEVQADGTGTEHTIEVYAPCLRYIKE